MNRAHECRRLLIVALVAVVTAGIPHCQAGQDDSQRDRRKIIRNKSIVVRVYNFARVTDPILASGERDASRILRRAGVEILWADCPLAMQEGEWRANCHGQVLPGEIDLRILPESMAGKTHLYSGALGFSAIDQDGEQGSLATLFYERIQSLAQCSGVYASTILGHAAAHEIGHLLLCSVHHSPTGIMRGVWGTDDLKRMGTRGLFFSAEDARRIRFEVQARGSQAPPLEMAGSRLGK